jgi:hypothetical protein
MPELMLPQRESFTFTKEDRVDVEDVRITGYLAQVYVDKIRKEEGWTGLIRTTVILVTSPIGVESITYEIEPDLGDSFLGEGI